MKEGKLVFGWLVGRWEVVDGWVGRADGLWLGKVIKMGIDTDTYEHEQSIQFCWDQARFFIVLHLRT